MGGLDGGIGNSSFFYDDLVREPQPEYCLITHDPLQPPLPPMSGDELSALLSSFEAAENARGAAQPVGLPAPDVSAGSLPPLMTDEEIGAGVDLFHELLGPLQPVDGPVPDNLAGPLQPNFEDPAFAFDFPNDNNVTFQPREVAELGAH